MSDFAHKKNTVSLGVGIFSDDDYAVCIMYIFRIWLFS